MRSAFLVVALAVACCAPLVSGAVYSPWVLSEHTPDFRDPGRFRQFAAWKDLEDQDLAVCVWKYLTDPVTGTYHFTDMYELAHEPHWEVKLIQDPMRILNVYGFAVCNMHSSMTCGLFKGMGFEQVRLAGWGQYHATPEIFWDGSWHYLDIDERAYILDDKGNLASGEALFNHPEWWEPSSKKVSPFYPQNGGLKGVQTMAKHGPPVYSHNWYDGGYTPDFVLRPGESVERFFQPQGYWRFADSYKEGSSRKIVGRDPRGPKSGGHSKNTYGNARFDYEPKIAAGYADYPQGAWSDENVALAEKGLILAADGAGSSTFYFQFPYIIVPQNGDLGTTDDDWDASVLRYKTGVKTTLKVSADNGITWQEIPGKVDAPDETIPGNRPSRPEGVKAVDLTKYVAGKYAFWVRFEYEGRAGESALESLKLTTWTQLAPLSLPRLKAGENHMELQAMDKYGLNTWTVPISPNCNQIEELKAYLHGEYDYDAERRRDRFRGPVTVKLEAPAGSLIEWLHIGAGLWSDYSKKPLKSGDRFLVALDEPKDFHPVWQAEVPEWVDHWYFRGNQEVKLDRPARVVYVRIEPTYGLLNMAFHLHVSKPDAAKTVDQPVTVTHKFKVNAVEKTVTRELPKPGPYTVTCDGEPENVSVRLVAPSVKAE
jgi:hypothetical protein